MATYEMIFHWFLHWTAMISNNSSRSHWLAIAAAFAAFVFTVSVFAQAPAASGGAAAPPSEEELDKLVGPIALYPDDLIAIILPASTNPLQIVQADRFLDKRKSNPKLPVEETWDDSVKSLLNYPDVVKTMSNDIDWTASLGEAVVADQAAVLAAVQTFRRKTQAAGNLKSDEKQKIVVEQEIITIAPADPQVIYVPQYNPSTVVVSGGYYSPTYYPSPYPVYYYPYAPGAALATGLVWGAAIGAAWNGGHYTTHYGGGTANININRSATVTGNVDRTRGTSAQLSTTQWRANKQPGQVRSTTRPTSSRVGYASSAGYSGTARAAPAAQSARSPGTVTTRQTTTTTRPTATTRQSASGGGFSGSGGAFSGSSSGYQANLDSSRGAASRNAMSSRSVSASPSSRAGGQGMMRGGGGGGRVGGGRR